MSLLPDFGTLTHEAIGTAPFRITVYSSEEIVIAPQPRLNITAINLIVRAFSITPPIASMAAASVMTIELLTVSRSRGQQVFDQLCSQEGLMLRVNPSRQYTTSQGETVLPLFVFKEPTEADQVRIDKAQAKRLKRSQKYNSAHNRKA